MKTTQEVIEYIQGKKYPLFDLITIQGYLHAKGIEEEFNIGEGKLFLAKDFIEWFERRPKKEQIKENLDTIIINGKEYEFFEDKESHCYKCDLMKIGRGRGDCKKKFCNNRSDNKEGYFKLKEQELQLIPNEFYYFSSENAEFIIQFKKIGNYPTGSYNYFYLLNVGEKALFIDEWCSIFDMRLATPEEKQQLINAVEKQENKHWNESTKTFELQILVPENIKIIKYQNNQLGLVFNDNKQVLTFSEGVYIVQPLDKLDKFIPCRLEKTTFEKLEVGEIFISVKSNIKDLMSYDIKLSDNKLCYIATNTEISILDFNNLGDNIYFYKLIPIK